MLPVVRAREGTPSADRGADGHGELRKARGPRRPRREAAEAIQETWRKVVPKANMGADVLTGAVDHGAHESIACVMTCLSLDLLTWLVLRRAKAASVLSAGFVAWKSRSLENVQGKVT